MVAGTVALRGTVAADLVLGASRLPRVALLPARTPSECSNVFIVGHFRCIHSHLALRVGCGAGSRP